MVKCHLGRLIVLVTKCRDLVKGLDIKLTFSRTANSLLLFYLSVPDVLVLGITSLLHSFHVSCATSNQIPTPTVFFTNVTDGQAGLINV